MLSDTDIKNNLDKGIEIHDYEQTSLSPIGYDFRVGDWAFSLKQRKIFEVNKEGKILIKPGDTVIIETLESLTLSNEFGATIHSMVSLLTDGGISHISTTVDPTHSGKLLIQFHNQSSEPVVLTHGRPLCTVCFYRMDSPASMRSPHEPGRIRLKDALVRSAHKAPLHRRANTRMAFAILGMIILVGIVLWQFNRKFDPTTISATVSMIGLLFYILFKEILKDI